VLLYSALMGQWRYSLMTDKLSAAMQIAKRVHSLAREQNDSTLMIGAYSALASTLYFSGDFESTRRYAMRASQIRRSGGVQSDVEDVIVPAVVCLCYGAMAEWHFGEIASCHATIARIGETDFECWDKLWKASPSDPDVDSEEWVAFSECIHEYFRSRYENFPDGFYFWNDFSGDRTLDLKIATLSALTARLLLDLQKYLQTHGQNMWRIRIPISYSLAEAWAFTYELPIKRRMTDELATKTLIRGWPH
jgi:hypothetical protein